MPITKFKPSSASSKVSTTSISSIRSFAFAANVSTCSEGKSFGFTKHNFEKDMVFIALKVDPIFPEFDVSIRIILTCLFKLIIYCLCPYPQFLIEH